MQELVWFGRGKAKVQGSERKRVLVMTRGTILFVLPGEIEATQGTSLEASDRVALGCHLEVDLLFGSGVAVRSENLSSRWRG